MGSEMDTFAARLASFDIVLKPEKRRSSVTKGSKHIAWPHKSPSPADLAHAGFYYKPYETNPDNTTCFHCHRALDGWEEEDNPIDEHLKHAPDCAWAIMMDIQQRSSNPAEIEDPTGERVTQARLATFGSAWPHDGKRGWVCQSDKMVQGGWFFAPTEESNDLASCVYCKLSLDGWEPKDDPFDEHHRRSSDCSFFVFAQPPTKKGKASKAKKPRSSKASRLSTQSVATTVAADEPEMDVDDAMDQSIMSQATTKSSKSTKKSTKAKGKGTKSKKEEPVDAIDVDSIELAQPEPPKPKPKRATRGKKRASEEMNAQPVDIEESEDTKPEEPPAKRRATRTRSSSVAQSNKYETNDYAMPDAEPVDEPVPEKETKKGRKASKKGAASKSRKVSDVSTASRATSKARVPRDSEIEAAIEAGLEADEQESAEPDPEPAQTRTLKKTKSTKKSKAATKAEQQAQDADEEVVDREEPVAVEEIESPVKESPAKSKTAKAPKKGTKKTKSKAQETRESIGAKSVADDHDRHESFVSVEIINRHPGPSQEPEPESELEPEPEPTSKTASKKGTKKKDAPAKKSKKSAKKTTHHEEPVEPEEVLESPVQVDDDDDFQTPEDIPDQVEMVAPPQQLSPTPQRSHRTTRNVPAKTTKRYSDIPAEHLAESLASSQSRHNVPEQRKAKKVASPPAARQYAPSMSPQSSDAENRPPSARPSASRPPIVVSPPKERTPLAATTPSPSKRNVSAKPVHPWTPVDVDFILSGEASDKENADLAGVLKDAKAGLTSPEKKMTVEEWIMWNAKNGEERLKRECERLVGVFEREGGRAMRRLDAIECID
ncbi:hypothetical protein N7474_005120 [Penicillium riverlandense]|uniref:uncharacterized protein n=1 Tax=Penicillium riverlandense TaxID=1903569 RepID=UPI002549A034|nr:uncharacterized protein N7474_005120 [Penicillium riverlandense]KAJ5819529.1 hypothetical protein N7474_005120 [Penicillium riverlandense]